jgi:hypothetical protein
MSDDRVFKSDAGANLGGSVVAQELHDEAMRLFGELGYRATTITKSRPPLD